MGLKRIHVVGCRRSGTTLLAEMLGNCFAIDGRIDHEQSLWKPIREHRDKHILLTKKPPDTLHMAGVLRFDPELHVIAMVRDPRAAITSSHKFYKLPDAYFTSFWRWEAYMLAIRKLAQHPRYLVVRYEELVRQPDQVQARIAEHFPFLRQTGLFSRFPEGATVHVTAQQSMNGLREPDPHSLEKWRQHLPRIKGEWLQNPQLSEWLIAEGYEVDRSWEAALDDVEPFFGDYKNVRPHMGRRLETFIRYHWHTLVYLMRRRLRI